MRRIHLIVTIALLTALAGCSDSGPSAWRGPKQEVPITPPSEEADGTHDQPAPHAPQSAAGQEDPATEAAYARNDAENAPVQQTTPSSEPQPMPVPPVPVPPVPVLQTTQPTTQPAAPLAPQGQPEQTQPTRPAGSVPTSIPAKPKSLTDLVPADVLPEPYAADRPTPLPTISALLSAEPGRAQPTVAPGPVATSVPVRWPSEPVAIPEAAATPAGPAETVKPDEVVLPKPKPQPRPPAGVSESQPPAKPSPDEPAGQLAPSEPRQSPPPQAQPQDVPARPAVGTVKTVSAATLQVNDRFITPDEIITAVHMDLQALPTDRSRQEFRLQAERIVRAEIHNQTGEAMVLVEAKSRLSDRQTKQIDAEIEDDLAAMIAEHGGSRTKLAQSLAASGTSLDEVVADMRRRLTVQTYLREKFAPAIAVNRRMLWEYYNDHLGDFTAEKMVQTQIIATPLRLLVAPGAVNPSAFELKNAKIAARRLIGQASAALKDGQDFAAVATDIARKIKADQAAQWDKMPVKERVYVEKMAQGGLWPMMSAGSFDCEAVEAAAFVLGQGQFSSIIETDDGFFIVRAARVKPGKSVGFEQAQEDIEAILRRQQFRKLVDDYFLRLSKGTTIVQPDEFVSLTVDRAVAKYHKR